MEGLVLSTESNKVTELIVSIEDGVASLEINRPEKMNSLTPAVLGAMTDELARFSSSDSVRCVVISGCGGKSFSSGYDFSFIGTRDMLRDYDSTAHPLAAACCAIENFARPVIAMVCGHAIGGGFELALACDFIVCSDNSEFSMPPAKLGIAYPFSGLSRVARAAGVRGAKRMFFTAEMFSAYKALEMNIVCEVVPVDSLRETVFRMARRIAAGAPLSIEAAKTGLNAWDGGSSPPDEHADGVRSALEKAQNSLDFKEAMDSVRSKTKPVFRGK